MAEHQDDSPIQVPPAGEDSDDPEEYVVEAIRAKRKNARTGGFEYLIKWENFPESDNTWEPREHLKCPEIVHRFEDAEKEKRRLRKAEKMSGTWNNANSNNSNLTPSGSKRARLEQSQAGPSNRRPANDDGDVFVENDDHDEDENNLSATTSNRKQTKDSQTEQMRLKGFERGLPIESILAGTLDDSGKLWFIVKWIGRTDLELVTNDDMECKAPKELCKWYRQRLYWSIDDPCGDTQVHRLQMQELMRQNTI